MTSATADRRARRSTREGPSRVRPTAAPRHEIDLDGPPQPLGPDSLTWKYFADLRTGLLGVWIGSIQNMYPELGAGVEDHSILLREPLQRVTRSVFPIMGVVYDGDRAADTGRQIRGYHSTIKGVDSKGRRYHALNPETFYWAHATFFMLIINTAEYFCGGLTEAEKRQLFAEHVQWYRMYGMSMRPVPISRMDRTEDQLNIPDGDLDTSTPQQLVTNLRRLVLDEGLDAQGRDLLTDWLKRNTTGDQSIRAGVPTGWTVGDKTGSGFKGETNDIAVIWPTGRAPIVVAVLTVPEDPKSTQGKPTIAAATRIALKAFGV
ncbi:oxygenase MpaB family protein [Mycobacteroides chelonae]|uniref:oxygenase MpaB family protein n=1 Tax=Mycobacteroides chelonae TaxID=1774 RepID=UPI003AAD0C6C